MPTAFISGHTDITSNEFKTHYVPHIDSAIMKHHKFVTAAAYGTDVTSINYLLDMDVPSNYITVYLHDKYFHRKEEYEAMGINVKGPFSSHLERDKQLTVDSDYDIAWVRSDELAREKYGQNWKKDAKSSVELNLERRKGKEDKREKRETVETECITRN